MKLMMRSNFKFTQIIILLLLFLGSMNVGNLRFYFLFGAFLVGVLANARTLRVDGWAVGLVAFSLCYIVFYPESASSATAVLKHFIYPMCYVLGLNFVGNDHDAADLTDTRQRERLLSFAVITPALGEFVHYLLNMALNISSLSRNTVDVWTGEIIVATGQASLAVMAIGVFAAWLFSETTKFVKVLAVVGLVLAFAYNFVLAGRTLILLSLLILILAFVYAIKTSRLQRKGKILFASLLVVLILFAIYTQNLFGIRDWILGSNFSLRFDTMLFGDDARMGNKRLYFINMFHYPFGGDELRALVGGYAHELYLDVYSDVGIVGYCLVIAFVGFSVVKAWKIFKSDTISDDFKLLLLCVYVAILAEFFIEPIIRSIPWMFYTLCFYSGILKAKLQSDKGR